MSNKSADSGLREILLVGCGNMGFALLEGWLAGDKGLRVHVVEPDEALRRRAEASGASVSESQQQIPADIDPQVIVMAVKPHYVTELLPQYARFTDQGAFVLSVAAGVTLGAMAAVFDGPVKIVRCMPNTPAAIGSGALVCCLNGSAEAREEAIARQLLSASGKVYFVTEESQMDAVTAVSGSGPAYIFHFVECLENAGMAAGLPADLARDLALQTTYGAGLLARNSDQSPGKLRQQVTSPNGTTAAALDVLMAPDGLQRLVNSAVNAAKARSVKLGS